MSLRERMEAQAGERLDFDGIIRDAVALLKGEKEIPGLDPDELREQLLQGFSHILVDEYQDIDQDQYELVSAIAGRTLEEGDGRLAILAVGDDDQNIYAFRGANVQFIRRFQEEYTCGTVCLVENYRSSNHIIQAANRLIAGNRDRMKREQPIRIDRLRQSEPAGGSWAERDPLAQGRVQRLRVGNHCQQSQAVYAEMMRLKSLDPSLDWADFAMLGRTRALVDGVRAFLEDKQVPARVGLSSGLPLQRVREVHRFLLALRRIEKEIRRASELAVHLARRAGEGGSDWAAMLEAWHTDYLLETTDTELPVSCFIEWLYEAIAEQRREKTVGRGVVLSTVHGAKGLEFGHVFILDGDWRRTLEAQRREEERRLLYVGLTRARQTLCLMEMEENGNPFLPEMDGPWMLTRRVAPQAGGDDRLTSRRYDLLSLADINLGYAGRFPEGHAIHKRLAALGAGDSLRLAAVGEDVELQTVDGFCVAKLSAKGSLKWSGRLGEIADAKIIAMVQWFADSSKEEYRSHLKADAWEVPLVELAVCEAQ